MNPVLSLKRSTSVDLKLCIFCQQKSKPVDDVREAGQQGLASVKQAASMRRKLFDVKNREVIDCLENIFDTKDAEQLVWHRNCYSQFTDKGKIQRLHASQHKQSGQRSSSATQSPCDLQECSSSRSKTKPVNWELCLFCQDRHPQERLSSVMTFKVSNQIIEAAKYDYTIGVRLAGVVDLIAAEAKYHLGCFRAFTRSTEKARIASKQTDLPILWICDELRYAAEKGHVLQLDDVWDRYMTLSEESGVAVPQSFISRQSSFKEKLQSKLGDIIDFVQPLGSNATKQIMLVPLKYVHNAVSKLASGKVDETDEMLTMPTYQPGEDIFLSMVHVALQIRGDMIAKAGHRGLSVSEGDAIACVPDSLYMFIRLLFGGQNMLEKGPDEITEKEDNTQQKVLSIAQDLIYGVSGGRKWTPKHIGLGSTLHQATRSKDLVKLFHEAGHILSYEQILQIDTGLAEKTLETMDLASGTVVPQNLVQGRFVHYSADNIDILDETLDGKDTFHATQITAWQRGPSPAPILDQIEPSTKRILNVPENMERLFPVNKKIEKVCPVFSEPVDKNWFETTGKDIESVHNAQARDVAFLLQHETSEVTEASGWTVFNQELSNQNAEITTIGYMPILQAPAHELDTLNTVVKRCLQVSSHIGQQYTVLTVDQALYGKLMELKWATPEYQDKLIPRLGGLHTSMSFLKVIGKHMSGSGLPEAWVESSLLGPNTAEQVLNGKAYKKAVRTHKITLQALWRLLMPSFLAFCKESNPTVFDEISSAIGSFEEVEKLIMILKDTEFQTLMDEFAQTKSLENVNFVLWWEYIQMISILLMFIRAQRDGVWDLHLHSFTCMMPYFFRYDHYNYARWGLVYLAEMCQLPKEVLDEFKQGNFVVKCSEHKFNQVDPDHAQEWLNGTGKRGGGIVGITKISSALSRWALSYSLRSQICLDTHAMYHLATEDCHNEATPARKKRDLKDEGSLVATFQQFNVFVADIHPTCLHNIATKDLASDLIQNALLNARALGQKQMNIFVEDRLLGRNIDSPATTFHYPIQRNNAPTFETLYEPVKDSKEKDKGRILRADRSVLQCLIIAYEAGRKVDLENVLRHELMPVPISLAEMNGSLRTGTKSVLADVLTSNTDCPQHIDLHGTSCLLIDGQALVVALGKPVEAQTFGDLADRYVFSVLQAGSLYEQIDVVFDQYREHTIKVTTRKRRTKSARPIRRVIEGRDVPLPANWPNFLALPENKADLARFLSEQLIENAPSNNKIIVAGGFRDEPEVQCSQMSDVSLLMASHEEADTRLILHGINSNCNTVVVSARDTDVLLLLLAHFPRFTCQNLWMMGGTSKERKYFNINAIFEQLPPGSENALLPFHALTGCDTTSFICGHSKKSAWKIFVQNHELLSALGEGQLTEEKLRAAEKFICCLYKLEHVNTADNARCVLFSRSGKPEAMPPSSNALQFHIMRAHYQSQVWKQAHISMPELPAPDKMGWKQQEGCLEPILMTTDPIPKACQEVITCSCHSGCRNLRCGCKKAGLFCTTVCGCNSPSNCANVNPN